jgi:hypothetical protein
MMGMPNLAAVFTMIYDCRWVLRTYAREYHSRRSRTSNHLLMFRLPLPEVILPGPYNEASITWRYQRDCSRKTSYPNPQCQDIWENGDKALPNSLMLMNFA